MEILRGFRVYHCPPSATVALRGRGLAGHATNQDFEWTTGRQPGLQLVKVFARGGYGTVHQVSRSLVQFLESTLEAGAHGKVQFSQMHPDNL